MGERVALVIVPGSKGLSKAVNHPAGLSAVQDKIKSKIPYESHEERMKLAKMAAERMKGASAPESEKQHTSNPVVDRKGRVPGEKAPYSKFNTSVSGMESSAEGNYGKVTYVVKPSELGSSAPQKGAKGPAVSSIRKK